nr:VanZ family protein [uncultured Desulfobulbus sp.]
MSLWDLGHVLFFAFATFFFLQIAEKKMLQWKLWQLIISVLFTVVAAGSCIEWLQSLTSDRSPDIMDVVRNQIGCFFALSFSKVTSQLCIPRIKLKFLKALAVVLLLFACIPLIKAFSDEQVARSQFPLLADFETPFEISRWTNTLHLFDERTHVRHGSHALRVQLTTAKYSGTALFHFPGNWQGYSFLHWSVYNTLTSSLPITLRIHDVEHKKHGSQYSDRFNRVFQLQPGWNDLTVNLEDVRSAPKNRSMDMKHIELLGFFVIQLSEPSAIIVDHFYLSR